MWLLGPSQQYVRQRPYNVLLTRIRIYIEAYGNSSSTVAFLPDLFELSKSFLGDPNGIQDEEKIAKSSPFRSRNNFQTSGHFLQLISPRSLRLLANWSYTYRYSCKRDVCGFPTSKPHVLTFGETLVLEAATIDISRLLREQ